MVLILAIFIVVFFAVLIIFSFPQLSPIPYYPSNAHDIEMILKGLKLKNNQVIIDLGAGDGVVIFKAAKQAHERNLNTLFIAVETNPILMAVLWVRWLFQKNRNNITIAWQDMFKTNYKKLVGSVNNNHEALSPTFYLYISPWLIKKAVQQIEKTVHTFDVVSYFYEVPDWKPQQVVKGHHVLNLYSCSKDTLYV